MTERTGQKTSVVIYSYVVNYVFSIGAMVEDSGNLPPPASARLLLDPAASGQDELPPVTVRSQVGANDAGVIADESTLLGAFKHNDSPCIYIVLLPTVSF